MELSRFSSDSLVEKFLLGCSDSFLELISRKEDSLLNTLMCLSPSPERAEEVLVDILSALLEMIGNDKAKTPLFPWLEQLVLDKSVASLVGFNREHPRGTREGWTAYDVAPGVIEEKHSFLLQGFIKHAVADLPYEYQQLILLRDVLEIPISKVSGILAITVFEVRAKHQRARLMMRSALAQALLSSIEKRHEKRSKVSAA